MFRIVFLLKTMLVGEKCTVCGGPPIHHSCQVWLNSVQWFSRRWLKYSKIWKISGKKGKHSKMGYLIYFNISVQVDLVMLIIFIPCQIFFISVTVFELFGKTVILPLCSIFSNGGHVFHPTGTNWGYTIDHACQVSKDLLQWFQRRRFF